MTQRICLSILLATQLFQGACASKTLSYDKADALKENEEFSQQVQIVEVPPTSTAAASGAENSRPVTASSPSVPPSAVALKSRPSVSTPAKKKTLPRGKKKAKSKRFAAPEALAPVNEKRQPEIESDLGFVGRRPVEDPFRVGEKVVHAVRYFKMEAGTLTLETRPFAQVNGKKNYQFRTSIKTSSLFSSFYSVDDYVDVLMDYENLIPSVFTLHVKETSQLKEAQMLFNHEKNQATFWEKKVTSKSGEERKKQQWDIMPYSQNVFSAAFYMRVFQWEVGKENSFYVSDDEKNLVFRGKAIRRERISTPAGDFNAIVIRPELELKGKFSPVGENLIWLSDDNRKFILRIESKIKIGTLVSEVVEINRGQ